MKIELLSKKESKLGSLKTFQPIHIAKNKICSEGNAKGVAEQPLDKEVMSTMHGFNQPFQQKPGIRDVIILEETLLF